MSFCMNELVIGSVKNLRREIAGLHLIKIAGWHAHGRLRPWACLDYGHDSIIR